MDTSDLKDKLDMCFTQHNKHMANRVKAADELLTAKGKERDKVLIRQARLRDERPEDTESPWNTLGFSQEKKTFFGEVTEYTMGRNNEGSYAELRDFMRHQLKEYYESFSDQRPPQGSIQNDFVSAMRCMDGGNHASCNATAFAYIMRYASPRNKRATRQLETLAVDDIHEMVHFVFSNTFLGCTGYDLPICCLNIKKVIDCVNDDKTPISECFGYPILALQRVFEILFVNSNAGFCADAADGIDINREHQNKYQTFRAQCLQLQRFSAMARAWQHSDEPAYNLKEQRVPTIPQTYLEWFLGRDEKAVVHVDMHAIKKMEVWRKQYKTLSTVHEASNSKMRMCQKMWAFLTNNKGYTYLFSPNILLDHDMHRGMVEHFGMKQIDKTCWSKNLTQSYTVSKRQLGILRDMFQADFMNNVQKELSSYRAKDTDRHVLRFYDPRGTNRTEYSHLWKFYEEMGKTLLGNPSRCGAESKLSEN